MIRFALMSALFSLAAFGQQSQVYLDQFTLLRGQTDSLFKELSNREIPKYDTVEEMMQKVLTEPSNRVLALSRSVNTLNQTILKSWEDTYGKKGGGGEYAKFEYLMYACSGLSLKLDAMSRFVGVFGSVRNWLDLATFQDLSINSALNFLGQVKP